MIHSFRKFFEFAGRQSRNWYLGLFYEIIRCILEALQFAALLVVRGSAICCPSGSAGRISP